MLRIVDYGPTRTFVTSGSLEGSGGGRSSRKCALERSRPIKPASSLTASLMSDPLYPTRDIPIITVRREVHLYANEGMQVVRQIQRLAVAAQHQGRRMMRKRCSTGKATASAAGRSRRAHRQTRRGRLGSSDRSRPGCIANQRSSAGCTGSIEDGRPGTSGDIDNSTKTDSGSRHTW